MFGKYTKTIPTTLEGDALRAAIDAWCEENRLRRVKTHGNIELYRFGSPFLSNPIYIQLQPFSPEIRITGWVQTLLPFLRWKLIPTSHPSLSTKIDYRRKGGFFCYDLQRRLT